ncbi:MAG: Spy/CpxP family protein refolding chaperone [Betaproteobacteria bacterium]|nr:Spy/CpxP family protein refolding chaperone [Betaproteobacteria bacterium]
MKRTTLRKTLIAAALAGAAVLGTAAFAHGGGYGPGWGMGPGMMGGYGMGPGMMGGYGGYGMGPGMMWGRGPGYGAGPAYGLNLSDEQRTNISTIQEDTGRKQWDLMTKMQEERARLNELYYSDKRDDAAISKTYKKMSELRQQMFDNSLAARKQVDGVLTKEQREQFRRRGYGMGAY